MDLKAIEYGRVKRSTYQAQHCHGLVFIFVVLGARP